MSNVLITYYTKTNTTKEICEYIDEKLSGRGKDVTMLPLDQVQNLNAYDKIVIGAPINGMNWATDAKTFVASNEGTLKNKRVALFFDGYLLNNSYGIWNRAIKKSLSKYEAIIEPIAVGKFGGRVDKPFSGFPKLLFGSKKNAPLDRRDWSIIDAFIDKL